MADLERLATGIAAAHGAIAEVELTHGYPVTVNHDDAATFALETAAPPARRARHAVEMPTPVMGAEDWSYVLQEVNGAMAFLGTRPTGVPPTTSRPNHSNRMVLDEDAMVRRHRHLRQRRARWLAPPSRDGSAVGPGGSALGGTRLGQLDRRRLEALDGPEGELQLAGLRVRARRRRR